MERVVRAKLRGGCAPVFEPSNPHGGASPSCGWRWRCGRDTSVIDDGAILGKPESVDEAEAMVVRLAVARRGVDALRDRRTRTRRACAARGDRHHARDISLADGGAHSRVRRERRGDGQKQAPTPCNGLGAGIVARIDGSYTNVVGLPGVRGVVALERLGLAP